MLQWKNTSVLYWIKFVVLSHLKDLLWKVEFQTCHSFFLQQKRDQGGDTFVMKM